MSEDTNTASKISLEAHFFSWNVPKTVLETKLQRKGNGITLMKIGSNSQL